MGRCPSSLQVRIMIYLSLIFEKKNKRKFNFKFFCRYYKSRGYLRDLTLDDYMKWEEWWYKYQEWLEAERYYEHWANIRSRHNKGRRYGVKMS